MANAAVTFALVRVAQRVPALSLACITFIYTLSGQTLAQPVAIAVSWRAFRARGFETRSNGPAATVCKRVDARDPSYRIAATATGRIAA